MQTNVLEYLEATEKRVPDKIAFADEQTELSFRLFQNSAKKIGTFMSGQGLLRARCRPHRRQNSRCSQRPGQLLRRQCVFMSLRQRKTSNRARQ